VGGLEIAPFSEEHLDAATTLLAARHARHRAATALLPDREGDAGEALAAAWGSRGASGAAALRAGRLEGFLVGAPRADPVWGANVWVESGGHAVEDAETLRDLYALAAGRWVAEGRTRHYVLVPASETAVVEAWFRLCFGLQHAHGGRDVPAASTVEAPPGFTIRAPAPADVDGLIEVGLALPVHQRSSPVFSGVELPDREASRREWLSAIAADDDELLAAFAGDRPAACWSLTPADGFHQPLMRPDNGCFVGFASVLPEFRGAGLGTVLTNVCLARAAERGYEVMITDWRVTNLLASRFWPRRGFTETFLRLYRSIP
jgi:ribosomal protein S18 acetylase RimI-like enzyme